MPAYKLFLLSCLALLLRASSATSPCYPYGFGIPCGSNCCLDQPFCEDASTGTCGNQMPCGTKLCLAGQTCVDAQYETCGWPCGEGYCYGLDGCADPSTGTCCPSGQTYDNGICCDQGQSNVGGKCCTKGAINCNGICCPGTCSALPIPIGLKKPFRRATVCVPSPQSCVAAGFAAQVCSTAADCPDEGAEVKSCYNGCCAYITIPQK
jgi:hypothetical protein